MRFVSISSFGDFLGGLWAIGEVFGPKARENRFVFDRIEREDEIAWDAIPTVLPPKKYVLPQREPLLDFGRGEAGRPRQEPSGKRIVLGVHTCDLAGFHCLDIAMGERPEDPYYRARKEKLVLFGLECLKKCDRYANCVSMGNYFVKGGFDLMFTPLGERFIVQVATSLGEEILERTGGWRPAEGSEIEQLESLRKRKGGEAIEELAIARDLVPEVFAWTPVDSPVWKDLDRRCIACGNCTMVCPTCYCFDVEDEWDLDQEHGTRSRIWDSCQNEEFAVASGFNFRKERGMRQRHRYYRKFKYPVDKYQHFFCIGCGRCTRTCMAGISLIETVDQLAMEFEHGT